MHLAAPCDVFQRGHRHRYGWHEKDECEEGFVPDLSEGRREADGRGRGLEEEAFVDGWVRLMGRTEGGMADAGLPRDLRIDRSVVRGRSALYVSSDSAGSGE